MTTHPALPAVGEQVEVIAAWWLGRGMPAIVRVSKRLRDDTLFPVAISIDDGREWAMAARELRRLP